MEGRFKQQWKGTGSRYLENHPLLILFLPYFPFPAVEAALRGDETPSRIDSISVGPPNHLPPPPVSSNTSRPPVPHHTPSSTATNGRQPSPSLQRPSDRPLPAIARVASKGGGDIAPPLPNRVTSPNSPKSRESLPMPPVRPASPSRSRDGPPLPQRGSLRGTRPSPPLHAAARKLPSPPVPVTKEAPPQASRQGGVSSGGRPQPPNRSGSRPQLPDKPRPALPSKPSAPAVSRKTVPPPRVGGGGSGGTSPVSIPSPDELAPQEMVTFFLTESPNIIAAVQSGSGNVPKMLDDLVTLGEAISEQVRGTKVQFRIRITKFRSGLSSLKTLSNITWYNSVGQIVEELDKLVSTLEVIEQNMSS